MKISELIRLLKKDGWFVFRQSGSHLIMKHPEKKDRLLFLIMDQVKLVLG